MLFEYKSSSTDCEELYMKKAPVYGSVFPELVKYGSPILLKMLRRRFERVLNEEDTVSEWKICYKRPVHKEGSRNDPNYYRGLAVIPFVGGLYSKLLKDPVENETSYKQQEEQAGFQAGRSVMDNIFTMKLICWTETHVALNDLEKLYDNVPMNKLREKLRETDKGC
ncbi:uncharacterized protein LOC124776111 [Schistocerca piceifrons]|uniref:uncharacterized protein LOC124776111 n=1 Tax=Schistocerca piceifrons TaxID=274613 RepID=UPI001F5EEE2F|nr:uncharacterized protein LOC124776111 [Schistocerca piceifrons]